MIDLFVSNLERNNEINNRRRDKRGDCRANHRKKKAEEEDRLDDLAEIRIDLAAAIHELKQYQMYMLLSQSFPSRLSQEDLRSADILSMIDPHHESTPCLTLEEIQRFIESTCQSE